MIKKYLKNIDFSEVVALGDMVTYQQGQIVSRTLVQNKALSLTLFAFDAGEEISSHDSTGDALVHVLDGEGVIIIDGKEYVVGKDKTIVMPANIPHSVEAKSPFKMLLLVVFPSV